MYVRAASQTSSERERDSVRATSSICLSRSSRNDMFTVLVFGTTGRGSGAKRHGHSRNRASMSQSSRRLPGSFWRRSQSHSPSTVLVDYRGALPRDSSHFCSERSDSDDGLPARIPSVLISSFRLGHEMPSPSPMILQSERSPSVPCTSREYHPIGTATLLPSSRSTDSVSSETITDTARARLLFVRKEPIPTLQQKALVFCHNIHHLAELASREPVTRIQILAVRPACSTWMWAGYTRLLQERYAPRIP